MGQVLHDSATTTEAVRRAIQHSQESLKTLSKRYGIIRRSSPSASAPDRPTGPNEPRSTVLSVEEEAVIVAFRRYTLPRRRFRCVKARVNPGPIVFTSF